MQSYQIYYGDIYRDKQEYSGRKWIIEEGQSEQLKNKTQLEKNAEG